MPSLNENLANSMLTEEQILVDYEDLLEYYADMEIPCKYVPATEDLAMPSIVAIVQLDDDEEAMVITHTFAPLDKEEGEFTKFLQFYLELRNPLDKIERLVLLEALNRINASLPLGSCTLIAARPEFDLPEMVVVRMVQGYPLEEQIDQGVFTEQLFLFELSTNLTMIILDELSEGKTLDEAFTMIGR